MPHLHCLLRWGWLGWSSCSVFGICIAADCAVEGIGRCVKEIINLAKEVIFLHGHARFPCYPLGLITTNHHSERKQNINPKSSLNFKIYICCCANSACVWCTTAQAELGMRQNNQGSDLIELRLTWGRRKIWFLGDLWGFLLNFKGFLMISQTISLAGFIWPQIWNLSRFRPNRVAADMERYGEFDF